MRVIEAGHVYDLNWLDGDPPVLKTSTHPEFPQNRLVFVNREVHPHPGTQTQEVIRALIDRTKHCDSCLRWEGNDLIVQHLRMALALHEARAILRKTEKGYIKPEELRIGPDGHFVLGDSPVVLVGE
jgi:hypothetical protein